jgi:hypothetical protein
VVECLPSKYKALTPNPSIAKKSKGRFFIIVTRKENKSLEET